MKRVRSTLIAAGLVVGTLAALAPAASAIVVHLPHGHFLGVSPRRGVSPISIRGSVAANAHGPASTDTGVLNYHGGPLLHSSAPYLIFWTPSGESMPAGSESLMQRYFADVAAASGTSANVYGVARQYTDGSGFADYRQTFAPSRQVIVDTHGYPAPDSSNCPDVAPTYPTCITDAQLQAELARLIDAGRLPSGTGNAPIYFIVTPADVNVCADAADCADNAFCAYHSSFSASTGTVLYAAIPFFINGASAAQNPKLCQVDGNSGVQEPNGDLADVAIGYMSHEDNEAITDPLGTGWWDSGSGNEDGDNCHAFGLFDPAGAGTNPDAFAPTLGGSASGGTLYDQSINGDPYYIQSEWSNGDSSCELRPASGPIVPTFTTPAPGSSPVGATLTFDPSASTSPNAYSSETWNFGDGTPPASDAGPALTTASHSYPIPGNYTITLTLVDDRGNLASAAEPVTVGSLPGAAFSFSPGQAVEGSSFSFDGTGSADPDPGVTISAYTWDFGDGSVGTGATPTHRYTAAGAYVVTLTVTNSLGLMNASTQEVIVGDEATRARVLLTTRHPASGQPVSFDGSQSSDPDGSIVAYAWSFGDRSAGTGAKPRHTYAKPGSYTVRLTVTDRAGHTAGATQVVTVALAGRITNVTIHKRSGGAILLIRVSGPGQLSAGGKTIRSNMAGTVRFSIPLKASALRTLARMHTFTLRVALRFVPLAGRPSTRTVTIRFDH
jgi:PKD repeat protein